MMLSLKRLLILAILYLAIGSGCSPADENPVPPDFLLIMDVHSAEDGVAHNVNIRIDAQGRGRYDRYDTGGVIRGDEDDMVVYDPDQIIESGEFRVQATELAQLWTAITENDFFDLTGDYRMAIGHSYAFIVVEADDRRHQVFNIGMDVPEIGALVEAIGMVLPAGVEVVYRRGFMP